MNDQGIPSLDIDAAYDPFRFDTIDWPSSNDAYRKVKNNVYYRLVLQRLTSFTITPSTNECTFRMKKLPYGSTWANLDNLVDYEEEQLDINGLPTNVGWSDDMAVNGYNGVAITFTGCPDDSIISVYYNAVFNAPQTANLFSIDNSC